ncbi:hypothetical protein HD806DRAFT_511983 [Xylariaceae sp. AK1471]|nr:hypothetical protein HD806DRAFT_511983 [Xylariaceae sp. AK1471]
MSAKAVSKVNLLPEHMGLARVDANPDGSIEVANHLLQKNHDRFHMFFRPVAGHNHIPHSILSVLAMGGGPPQLKRAYDDGESIQRPLPSLDLKVVESLKDHETFRETMLTLDQYTNFLAFFEHEIETKGWQTVVQEYCLSRTPTAEAMLAQLYEGLYHPIIHLGFGIEFKQPSIVAEGLAQTASHDPMFIDQFFQRSEQLVHSSTVAAKPLVELYHEVRTSDKLRTASRIEHGAFRIRDSVLPTAMDEIVGIAARFQVSPDEIERATAEMISCAAYCAGAAQRAGKQRKIDFFLMHIVTSSIFLTTLVQQSWIKLEDKVRLIEWKGRIDLLWYAACAAPELHIQDIADYEPTLSKGLDWRALYRAVNDLHDDGHVAKFIRAIKNGEEVAKPFEQGDGAASFPVKGDMWFKVAQMAYDTTTGFDNDQDKWVWGAGFNPPWMKIPDMAENP